MWNPRSYDDVDYGLGSDESFEPETDEAVAPQVALTDPHIMTILGPIPPEELGICLPHVHLLCDPPGADQDHRLTDVDAAESEIDAFVTMNGRSLVECTTRDTGRMIAPLLEIAGWVPAHLIAVTGRHSHQFASHMPDALDVESLTEEFIAELDAGIDGTSARAGVIKVGTSLDQITEIEHVALRAAAKAQLHSGAPITTHTEHGTMAMEIIDHLAGSGVPANQIIVGHVDRVNMSLNEHLAIAKAGAFLQFDQIGKSEIYTDQMRAERIVDLCEAGFANQILLSLDYARRSLLVSYDGAPGLPYLSEWFMILLVEAGLAPMDVRGLVIDNPARALTINRPA